MINFIELLKMKNGKWKLLSFFVLIAAPINLKEQF